MKEYIETMHQEIEEEFSR